MTFRPNTIFIFSMEPWGDMWYSKHHYAAYLSRSYSVYFVSLPDRWRWRDLFSFGVKVRTTPEGVKVVEYRNNLPLRALPNWLARLVNSFNAYKLRKLVPQGDVLFWCFYPIISVFDIRTPGARFIYHVVDPYQSLDHDTAVAERADLVVAINPWYQEHYSKLNKHCILIPHGVRKLDRKFDINIVRAHQDRWGEYALLATGLGNPVNYTLLIKVAERFPELKMIIAGELFRLRPVEQALRDKLFSLPNVDHVGVKHPDELKQIVRGARLGLLTYDFEVTRSVPASAGRTPLKVLTYLSQLCPVVSTNNSYVPPLDGKGFFKAEDQEHFLQLIGEILRGEKNVDTAAVEDYMDSVEYGKLVNTILSELKNLPRRSPAGSLLAVEHLPERPLRKIPDGKPQRIPVHSPVLIVSNEAWDGPRYSKHRFGIALTAYRDVYFIDPAPQWEPTHLFRTKINAWRTPEGITVLSYYNAVPLLGGILGGINDLIIFSRLRRYLRWMKKSDPVLWTFDPSRLVSPRQLDAVVSVYHCADDHAFRMRGERLLALRCDHVFCIARGLMPRFETLNASVHHVPHGLSEADMRMEKVDPAQLPCPPGYGLYIGNINDRHDFELWEKLILQDPTANWVVAGNMNVTDPVGMRLLKNTPPANLINLGPIPYPELRKLITGSGFGFLFMKPNDPANRYSSQKVVQFLALGKPFFCSWFSEYEDKQDLIYMSDDHEQAFAQFTHWSLHGEGPDPVASRLEFAQSLRFDRLIADLPFSL